MLHISQLADTRWCSLTHGVTPKAQHHKYIKLKHRSFTYPWLVFPKWAPTPLSRIWIAFKVIRPLESSVKLRKYTPTYRPGHCGSVGTFEMVTIVLHFLFDHFIWSVSNFHSSQHSTEAFKRSFVHSCITKLKSKSRFGFKSSLPPKKPQYPSYKTSTLNSKSLIKYRVTEVRQDKALDNSPSASD